LRRWISGAWASRWSSWRRWSRPTTRWHPCGSYSRFRSQIRPGTTHIFPSFSPHFLLIFPSFSPHFPLIFSSFSPHFPLIFLSFSSHFHLIFSSFSPPHFLPIFPSFVLLSFLFIRLLLQIPVVYPIDMRIVSRPTPAPLPLMCRLCPI
jgi:hypothetical protein